MPKIAKPKEESSEAEAPTPAEHYYQSIQGYFDWPDVYRDAVAFIPDGGTFVEVGCWRGMSMSFFLIEAKNSGKQLKVFGVDHFAGSVGDQPLLAMAAFENIEAECRDNVARANYPCEIIRCVSHEAAKRFPDGSLDYVFIDDSHDYQSVWNSVHAWKTKVKPGGIIAGHDINQTQVAEAVHVLLGEVETIPAQVEPGGPRWGDCWRKRI